MSADIRHSGTHVLLLRPLHEMSVPLKRAMTRWLWDHGITPSSVAIGLPIERDDEANVLVWRERQSDGSITKRWRYGVHAGDALWPAPFPETLDHDTACVERVSRHA